MKNNLSFSVSQINRDFRIKLYSSNLNKLVGVSGFVSEVGIDLANKLLSRAYSDNSSKCNCLLRRGLQVTFYSK